MRREKVRIKPVNSSVKKLNRACLVFPLLLGILAGIHLFLNKTDYKRTCLEVGSKTLEVKLAETPEELEKGLSGVWSLKEDEGMLFIFEKEAKPVFHLGRVQGPVSVAFINEKGKVIAIEHMDQKHRDRLYTAPTGTRYALEVPSGWFEKNGVKRGSRIKGNRKVLKNGARCATEDIA